MYINTLKTLDKWCGLCVFDAVFVVVRIKRVFSENPFNYDKKERFISYNSPSYFMYSNSVSEYLSLAELSLIAFQYEF